jgi:hypothetical protein
MHETTHCQLDLNPYLQFATRFFSCFRQLWRRGASRGPSRPPFCFEQVKLTVRTGKYPRTPRPKLREEERGLWAISRATGCRL